MNSERLFEESRKYIPGGVNSPLRAFKPYPFFVKSGEGSHLSDVDGNQYIDYCLAYGPLILGHADPKVVEALKRQAPLGTTYGAPTEGEIKLAEEVVDRIPSAEMVRFVNSGTEATMSAIRVARGFTGRDKIVKFDGTYHGAHDYCLVKSGSGATALPDSAGIPVDTTKNTLTVPYNDEEALTKLIEEEGENIACIILEVVMGNIGFVPPKKGYLEFLRKITDENGILLIFDEVITGFRLSRGGAQEYYDVTPDMTTLGKIVGGGLPMGAFCGKKEIMEVVAPLGPVYQAGTFSGNPMSVQAGIAMLDQLDENAYNNLDEKGSYLRGSMADIIDDLGLDITPAGAGSMFQVYFNPNEVCNAADAKASDAERFLIYFRELLKEGIFIPPSQFECNFLSTAHTMEDLDNTAVAIEKVLKIAFEI